MNDIIAEMASDAGSNEDTIDKLKDDQLDSISKLANEAASLERKIADTEQLLKDHKQSLHKIRTNNYLKHWRPWVYRSLR